MNDQPMPATNLLVRIGANQASDERSKTALATPQTLLLDLVAPMPTSSMHQSINKYNLDTRWKAPPLLRHQCISGWIRLQKPANDKLYKKVHSVTWHNATWLQNTKYTSTFPIREAALPLCSYKNRTFEPHPRKGEDRSKKPEARKEQMIYCIGSRSGQWEWVGS